MTLLDRDIRYDTVRTCNEVCVAERVARLCALRRRLTIGSFGGVRLCAVLIERCRRDRLCGVELLIAREIRARELHLCARRGNARIRGVRLLLYVARVDDHEHIARADTRPDVHVARENLSADLKGELCLVSSAHRAGIARVACRRGIADRDRSHEGRRHVLFSSRAAARRGNRYCENKYRIEVLLHIRLPSSICQAVHHMSIGFEAVRRK